MRIRKSFVVILSIIIAIILTFLVYCAVKFFGPSNSSSFIELKGETEISLFLGDEYVEPGYIATDSDGNDISNKVKVDKGDITRGGTHEIKYTINDNGKTAEAVRTVEVKYKEPDKNDPHYGHGIPVCMYHNVFNPASPPPPNTKYLRNWISTEDLKAQFEYLVDNHYYFPTWQELRDYIDGKIELPLKSVILTFDDCSESFIKNGIPLIEKYDVRATSFVICVENGKEVMKKYKDKCKHINFQSHTYNMHYLYGSTDKGIFPYLPYDDGYEDMKKSIDILKSHEAFAYPYGNYNDTSKKVVSDLDFLCAFTTKSGMCHPGDDHLILPRVRIKKDMGADVFASLIKTDK